MADHIQKYSEEQLVDALRLHSEKAFNYLYEHYSASLYTVILNVINEPHTSADVLQDVFIKIWRQIESYDDSKGRLFTWMLRIARNSALDTLRSKNFRNNNANLELNESVYESETVQTKVEYIGLRKLVAQLKSDQRSVVEMSYFEGYTQAEIAKHLAIPEGTVKSRLRAGLLQLKQIMNQVGY